MPSPPASSPRFVPSQLGPSPSSTNHICRQLPLFFFQFTGTVVSSLEKHHRSSFSLDLSISPSPDLLSFSINCRPSLTPFSFPGLHVVSSSFGTATATRFSPLYSVTVPPSTVYLGVGRLSLSRQIPSSISVAQATSTVCRLADQRCRLGRQPRLTYPSPPMKATTLPPILFQIPHLLSQSYCRRCLPFADQR